MGLKYNNTNEKKVKIELGKPEHISVKVIGVLHIKAMLLQVLQRLYQEEITKNTLIFLEPSEQLLQQKIAYKHNSVKEFFENIIHYATEKNAQIMPLNAEYMPSHSEELLLNKCAAQLAEEEWMASVIAKNSIIKQAKNVIIIIGNVHAKRLSVLLSGHNFNVKTVNCAPQTPDERVLESWRKIGLGTDNKCIQLEWLGKINQIIGRKMNIPAHEKVQEWCWDNSLKFEEYQTYAKRLMNIIPIHEYEQEVAQAQIIQAHTAFVQARIALRLEKVPTTTINYKQTITLEKAIIN